MAKKINLIKCTVCCLICVIVIAIFFSVYLITHYKSLNPTYEIKITRNGKTLSITEPREIETLKEYFKPPEHFIGISEQCIAYPFNYGCNMNKYFEVSLIGRHTVLILTPTTVDSIGFVGQCPLFSSGHMHLMFGDPDGFLEYVERTYSKFF